jgi:molybdenum cofactor cytidylyltransferase
VPLCLRAFVVNLPAMEGVAAIVLAAGRSERMGAFKPLLPFGRATVIETCIEHLRDGGVETLIVVLSEGPHSESLKEHLKNARVTFAINPKPDSEMSDSIACGVRQLPARTKAVLITPADHPAVPAEVVADLIREWREGAPLVVPTFNSRGGHPVLIDLSFRAELLDLDSRLGLKTIFHVHPNRVSRLAVQSNYIARDMDTWEDYAALHRDVFGVLPPDRAKP